jgi:hypothetical protein
MSGKSKKSRKYIKSSLRLLLQKSKNTQQLDITLKCCLWQKNKLCPVRFALWTR